MIKTINLNTAKKGILTFIPQSKNNLKIVIGLVGKMASGKNYVASILEQQGWASVDADLLVHQAINQASQTIINTFSQDADKENIILTNSDGTINRRQLGAVLFKNPQLLKKQEDIVYPIISNMVQDFIQQHDKSIINATVLYKTPFLLDQCDLIVYVKSNPLKRFLRARKRDKIPSKQIINRFKSQKNLLKEYKNTKIDLLIIKN